MELHMVQVAGQATLTNSTQSPHLTTLCNNRTQLIVEQNAPK